MRTRFLRFGLMATWLGACSAAPERDYEQGMQPVGAIGDGKTGGGNMPPPTGGMMPATGGLPGGGDASVGATGSPPAELGDPADTCNNGTQALAQGIKIKDIAIYQTVKIPLVESGAWISNRDTPVIQGKQSLVRVFVEPLPGYTSRALLGVLTLDSGGDTPTYVTADLTPSASSSDSSLRSTFNFDIEGDELGASTTMSVAIVDKSCPSSLGNATDARFPETGDQPLGASKIGVLKVVVVPVRLSNGEVPDTSASQLEKIADALRAYYPVPDVEVSADDVLDFPYSVSSNGSGWSDLLNEIMNERNRDRPSREVYYFGLTTPASSFMGYCGYGCVLGLAPQTTFVSPSQQVGLGVGFVDTRTYGTVVHELGHAHGRGHAPCGGASGVDPRFPYSGGVTSTWGWDLRDGKLHAPSDKDIMGYCEPTWISDYTYQALADRSQEVNANALWASGASGETHWHGVLLYADGRARHSGGETTDLPGGELQTAQALDAQGHVVAETRVVEIPLSHLDDTLLYIANLQSDWASISFGDRVLELGSVLPPLL